jgi:hypothetical protein
MTQFKFSLWSLLAVLVFLTATPLTAAPNYSQTEQSHRTRRTAGILFGLNDPVPAVAGINIAFNFTDFFRLTAGVGRFNSDYNWGGYVFKTKSVTYGGGARLLVPGWNLSPIVGLSWATIATEGFQDDHHLYAVAGAEWQLDLGLNIGAGYERSFDSKIGGLPYLNIGWFL